MVTPPFWPHFAKDALARMGNIGFGPYDVACATLLSPPPGSENKKSYWMCRTVQIVKAYCLGLPVAWPKKRQPLCQEEDVEYAYQRDFLLGLELLSKYLPFLSHVWGVNYRLVPSKRVERTPCNPRKVSRVAPKPAILRCKSSCHT